MEMNQNKQQRLDQITADMQSDAICPDLAEHATNIVPGEGNPNAAVVFVGEAPGKQEDLTGRPFVGASGKVLSQLLMNIGLQREDVFITSIVKHRPPKNRDPSPAEKAAYWPYLLRQLRVIQPKIVVPLGRHSMGMFVPDQSIAQMHGMLIAGGEWLILPMYHPAAALYNHKLRATLTHDFLTLQKIIEGNYEPTK